MNNHTRYVGGRVFNTRQGPAHQGALRHGRVQHDMGHVDPRDPRDQVQLVREGDPRQPLYANAPPKPRRLNNSRDYSPSQDDNHPENLSHSNFSHESEMNHRLDDLPQFRHRLPQERRTPEAYGRSRFDASFNNSRQYPMKDYEEVYNNAYEYHNDTEVAAYNNHDVRRMSHGNMNNNTAIRNSQPPQYNAEQPMTHQRPAPAQKVARPHSADFLEYERSHPVSQVTPGHNGNVRNNPHSRNHQQQQPQRPKSCIGEKIQRSDDFWSEEGYAQKMRESAFVVDVSGPGPGVRTQSRSSHTLSHNHNLNNKTPNNVYRNEVPAGQGSTVPPPVYYQDNHRDNGQVGTSVIRPRSSIGQPHYGNHNNHDNSFHEDQEVANSNFPPSYQSPPSHPQQPRMTPQSYRYPPQQQPGHQAQHPPGYPTHNDHQMVGNHLIMNHEMRSEHREQKMMQPAQHPMSGPMQMSPNQHQNNPQNRNFNPSHFIVSQSYPHQQVSNANMMNSQFRGYHNENITKIITPPSIPQPLPRKQSVQTPTTYQNIPPNSKSYSDPRPVSVCRIDIATPSRLTDNENKLSDSPDFRRSASARLPKQKNRASDISGESDDSKKNGEAVGREESMKRLLNWKQRMLQSPLTRKSSRNASRTQTPTNSDSPVPSLNDDIRNRVENGIFWN